MARNFDLVICDIDGCLAPESSAPMDIDRLRQVAEHNRAALRDQDRPLLTLCSGRPLPFVEALCRTLQNSVAPCVAENGVWLYHPQNNFYDMDPRILPEHLHAVHEASQLLASLYRAHGVSLQPGKVAAVTLYHPEPMYLQSIVADVRNQLHRRGLPFRVSMTLLYINCDLEHVSKASGIRRLIDYLQVPQTRLAGIGDTTSDLAIADNVAFFGCPANALNEVKERATYVAAQEEIAGVLEILARL
jgi:hydroxymethylpyrimidine pyrophosphatase-like HAD family hydrolase